MEDDHIDIKFDQIKNRSKIIRITNDHEKYGRGMSSTKDNYGR